MKPTGIPKNVLWFFLSVTLGGVASGQGPTQYTVNTAGETVNIYVPRRAGYDPDCDGDGNKTSQDFSCFLAKYAAGELYADCDGSPKRPYLNVADFSCFLQSYTRDRQAPVLVQGGVVVWSQYEPWWLCNLCPVTTTAFMPEWYQITVIPDSAGRVIFTSTLPGWTERYEPWSAPALWTAHRFGVYPLPLLGDNPESSITIPPGITRWWTVERFGNPTE